MRYDPCPSGARVEHNTRLRTLLQFILAGTGPDRPCCTTCGVLCYRLLRSAASGVVELDVAAAILQHKYSWMYLW